MKRKKVLVVEDSFSCFEEIQWGLKQRVDVLHAATIEDAYDLFEKNSDVDAIIMDACVPGSSPTTMWLVEDIVQSGYAGKIIAASSMREYNNLLMKHGATHSSYKDFAAETVLKLLGLED